MPQQAHRSSPRSPSYVLSSAASSGGQILLAAFRDGTRKGVALQGLVNLGSADVDARLVEALDGPVSGTTSTALEIIGKQDDPRWCPHVYRLFRRVHPAQPIPAPHVWMAALRFLLRHGAHTAEVIAALPRACGTATSEAALVALEHAPDLALSLFRKALRDRAPATRREAAAILALIDAPWSRRKLVSTLATSREDAASAEVRAALRALGSAEAAEAVRAWEERHPRVEPPGHFIEVDGTPRGPFHTFEVLIARDADDSLRWEMEQLRDRVLAVRQVVPPEPSRPWWRFWRS